MQKITIWLSVLMLTATTAIAADRFDSDGDGFADNGDNCTLTFNAEQKDADGDFHGNACDGDLDQDGLTGFTDLSIFGDAFGASGDNAADFTEDGLVAFSDLQKFGEMFGNEPGPTGTDPDQPPCTCYFSGDCGLYGGGFCDYGGPFSEETNCVWRDGPTPEVGDGDAKPIYVGPDDPDNYFGCSRDDAAMFTGNWVPNICDGVCTGAANGSRMGLEDKDLVMQAVQIWTDSMIEPSLAGGGPLSESHADAARALPFSHADIAVTIGRHTGDLLGLLSGQEFADYFCHWEGHAGEPDPFTVDIQGDTCREMSARIGVSAFEAAALNPGSAMTVINDIKKHCPDWQTRFEPRCPAGENALACVGEFVNGLAQLLTTPPIRKAPTMVERLTQQ